MMNQQEQKGGANSLQGQTQQEQNLQHEQNVYKQQIQNHQHQNHHHRQQLQQQQQSAYQIKSLNSSQEESSDSDRAVKKSAVFGQWRTPPQPFFPSAPTAQHLNNATANTSNKVPPYAAPPQVYQPSSTEIDSATPDLSGMDLASLQEAYRRGMAAAAALSKHQMETGQNVFVDPHPELLHQHQSCPNLQELKSEREHTPPVYVPAQVHPPPSHMYTSQSSAPPLPPPAPLPQQESFSVSYPITPQQQQIKLEPIVQSQYAAPQPPSQPQPQPPGLTMAARSVSLPDFQHQVGYSQDPTSMATSPVPAGTTPDDEKRRKRLARNRASARLRRLRKKNLVESYEGEVTVLEQALSKLQNHKWNNEEADHTALLDALSMERGQQALDQNTRRELVKSILEQQREQVANWQVAHLESRMLGWLVRNAPQVSASANNGTDTVMTEAVNSSSDVIKTEERKLDEEEIEVAKELMELLNLSPEQQEHLRVVS